MLTFQNADPLESPPEPQAVVADGFVYSGPSAFEPGELPPSLVTGLRRFAKQIAAMDRSILGGHQLTAAEEQIVSGEFQRLVLNLERHSRTAQAVDPRLAHQVGREFQARMLPYLLLTGTAERWYSKPCGYAGDYLTIHQVYENRPSGHERIGALIDRCFLDMAAARAVRNRRGLLAREILRHHAESSAAREPFVALNLACGPAAEVCDILENCGLTRPIHFHLMDIDPDALAFVDRKATGLGVRQSLRLHRANVFRLIGRKEVDLTPINFAYSLGLIDYFDDRHAKRLLDSVFEMLAPGGQMILGNFHPQNPNRALMEGVLEWRLVHRSEEDMHRLCQSSRFAGRFDRIVFEEQGVNLLAIVRKR
jgi:extracellular factor (EF) 3-hydroxypalmitic acid methyl ester biosynthesis protein